MVVSEKTIYDILESVKDPEIPVISISELGVLRDVSIAGDQIIVTITPTYTGCPAMDMIQVNIRAALQEEGYKNVKINSILSPAWTTDWITEKGKKKMREYGISPPDQKIKGIKDGVTCPLCGSSNTVVISAFGSTACKALYRCKDCLEPFDYFKCH